MSDDSSMLSISVAFSPCAGVVDEVVLELREGATLQDAIVASGLQARYPAFDLATLPVGIWGAFHDRSARLRDRDRVELYRPLRVDPKDARRLRQRGTGAPATARRSR